MLTPETVLLNLDALVLLLVGALFCGWQGIELLDYDGHGWAHAFLWGFTGLAYSLWVLVWTCGGV